MFELSVESSFSAAHQLRGHGGGCERLHGHNWKVQVHVLAERLDDIDLAIDFHVLKKYLAECLVPLDHTMLNEVFPFTEKNPSSENIAKWVYDSMRKRLSDGDVHLSAVTVWESETASATYYED